MELFLGPLQCRRGIEEKGRSPSPERGGQGKLFGKRGRVWGGVTGRVRSRWFCFPELANQFENTNQRNFEPWTPGKTLVH